MRDGDRSQVRSTRGAGVTALLVLGIALALGLTLCRGGDEAFDPRTRLETDGSQQPDEPSSLRTGSAGLASRVELQDDASPPDPTAHPRTGLRVTGHLVDADGEPAPHCPVELVIEREPEHADESLAPQPVATGDFTVDLPEVPRVLRVKVGGNGGWCRRERIVVTEELTPGGICDLGRIELHRGTTLRGMLLDKESQPLPHAEVTLLPTVGAPNDGFSDVDPVGVLRLWSDASGAFTVDGLVRAGRWHSPADPPGPGLPPMPRTWPEEIVITASNPEAVESLVVRHQGLALRGVVRDADGVGVSGVHFTLALFDPPRVLRQRTVTSDESGRFVLQPFHDMDLSKSFRLNTSPRCSTGQRELQWGTSSEWRATRASGTAVIVRAQPGDGSVSPFALSIQPVDHSHARLEWTGPQFDSGSGIAIRGQLSGPQLARVAPLDPRLAPSKEVVFDPQSPSIVRVDVTQSPVLVVDVRRDERIVTNARVHLWVRPTKEREDASGDFIFWRFAEFDGPTWFVPGDRAGKRPLMVGQGTTDRLGRAIVRTTADERISLRGCVEFEGSPTKFGDAFTLFEVRPGQTHICVVLPPSHTREFIVTPDPGTRRFALISRGGVRIPSSGWLQGAVFQLHPPFSGEWQLEFDCIGTARSEVLVIPEQLRDSYTFDCTDRLPGTLVVANSRGRRAILEEVDPSGTSAPALTASIATHIEWQVAPGTWQVTLDGQAPRRVEVAAGVRVESDRR